MQGLFIIEALSRADVAFFSLWHHTGRSLLKDKVAFPLHRFLVITNALKHLVQESEQAVASIRFVHPQSAQPSCHGDEGYEGGEEGSGPQGDEGDEEVISVLPIG